MKLILEQTTLADMVNSAVRAAAPSGSLIPALSGMHLKATEGKLFVTANNLDLVIKLVTDKVEIVEEGEILVNAHYFTDLINKISGIISIEKTDNTATVKYGRNKGKLNTITDADWIEPKLKEGFEPKLTLKANELKKALQATMFACAKEHFRPIFTGVLFDIKKEEGVVNIVGSDTHRLSLYPIKPLNKINEDESFSIPAKLLSEFFRVFKNTGEDGEDDEIVISSDGKSVVLSSEKAKLQTRLLDGQYPSYLAIIPTPKYTIEVNAREFKDTLERAKTLPKDGKLQMVPTRLSFNGNGEMQVYSFSEIAGEISEAIALEKSANLEEEMNINFNVFYLHDYLKSCEETVDLSFTGPLEPILLTNGSDAKHVIVPLRIS